MHVGSSPVVSYDAKYGRGFEMSTIGDNALTSHAKAVPPQALVHGTVGYLYS